MNSIVQAARGRHRLDGNDDVLHMAELANRLHSRNRRYRSGTFRVQWLLDSAHPPSNHARQEFEADRHGHTCSRECWWAPCKTMTIRDDAATGVESRRLMATCPFQQCQLHLHRHRQACLGYHEVCLDYSQYQRPLASLQCHHTSGTSGTGSLGW